MVAPVRIHIARPEFKFSCAHMTVFPDGSKERLHGHNYIVVVELAAATLNAFGFVRDYNDLAQFKRYIDDSFDHRHLNEALGHDAVTSEYLAQHFYDWCKSRLPETVAVRVSETPKTWAEYRP